MFSFGIALLFCLATLLIIQFIQNKGEPEQSVKEPGRSGKLQLADPKVLPYAAIIMLFAIPYCATQSFLVSYTQTRQLSISVSLFFPLYAVVLLILRLCMKDLFDRLPFPFFLLFSSVSAFAGILFLAFMKNNLSMFFAALFMAGGYGIMSSVCQSTAILQAGQAGAGQQHLLYRPGPGNDPGAFHRRSPLWTFGSEIILSLSSAMRAIGRPGLSSRHPAGGTENIGHTTIKKNPLPVKITG